MQHLFIISIVITICGCSQQAGEHPETPPSDSQIRRNVVGTWVVDEQLRDGGSMKGLVTIDSDGGFASEVTIVLLDRKEVVSFEGTWEVRHGALIETVRKSNSKLARVGNVTCDKIISVDEYELVYQTETGESVTRVRGK